MGRLLEVVTPLHRRTQRDYLKRMTDDKVEAMSVAKKYGEDYWDGDRRYGYGGYKFIPGWWKPVAETLIGLYELKAGAKILDVGCGKGFLLQEFQALLPDARLVGFDTSTYALAEAPVSLGAEMFHHRAQDRFPFADNEFDLVLSLGTLHNLRLPELAAALPEIERVSSKSFLMVESYRNDSEFFNLECWALTAESLFDVEEWTWLFERFGYYGDYEFIFFE